MPKKEQRFVKAHTQDLNTVVVYVDRATGVNYLVVNSGYGVAVTPLIDRDGRPLVTEALRDES
ncbi:MAG: DUF6440 family protein [Christensenellaceae bacterium]|jgi:hypothetical protein|nr:DUF6440 family protein [Christensenellaceae bacterium]